MQSICATGLRECLIMQMILLPTSLVLGLGVFGFVDVTLGNMETAGPSPSETACKLDAPLPCILCAEELPFRGVVFFRVFGDFKEILKFSVWRPLANCIKGPCCGQAI